MGDEANAVVCANLRERFQDGVQKRTCERFRVRVLAKYLWEECAYQCVCISCVCVLVCAYKCVCISVCAYSYVGVFLCVCILVCTYQ